MQDHAVPQYYSVLIPVSRSYSQLEGRLLTCSSPLRHSDIAIGVRLACLIHAASVRSEPESNSPNKNCQADKSTLISRSQKLDLLLNSFSHFFKRYASSQLRLPSPFRALRNLRSGSSHYSNFQGTSETTNLPAKPHHPKNGTTPLPDISPYSADYEIRETGSHLKRCAPLRRTLT